MCMTLTFKMGLDQSKASQLMIYLQSSYARDIDIKTNKIADTTFILDLLCEMLLICFAF